MTTPHWWLQSLVWGPSQKAPKSKLVVKSLNFVWRKHNPIPRPRTTPRRLDPHCFLTNRTLVLTSYRFYKIKATKRNLLLASALVTALVYEPLFVKELITNKILKLKNQWALISMDISTARPKSDIHTCIYPWISIHIHSKPRVTDTASQQSVYFFTIYHHMCQ